MSITCPRCRTNFALSPDEIGTNGRKVRCSNCQHIWYQRPEIPTTAQPTAATVSEQSITPINHVVAEVASNREFIGDMERRTSAYGMNREDPSGASSKSSAEAEISKRPNQTLAASEINHVTSNRADNLVYPNKVPHLPGLSPLKIPQSANNVSIILINLIFLLLYILFHEKLNIFALPQLHDNKLIIENIQTNQTTINNQLKVIYRITNNNTHNIMIPLIRVRLLDKQYMPVKTYILDQKDIKLSSNQYIEINTTLAAVPPSSTSLDIMVGNRLDFILQ